MPVTSTSNICSAMVMYEDMNDIILNKIIITQIKTNTSVPDNTAYF